MEEIINGLYAVFAVDSEAQVFKGNKVAGARARKASLELEKAPKEFRKVSIEAGKWLWSSTYIKKRDCHCD